MIRGQGCWHIGPRFTTPVTANCREVDQPQGGGWLNSMEHSAEKHVEHLIHLIQLDGEEIWINKSILGIKWTIQTIKILDWDSIFLVFHVWCVEVLWTTFHVCLFVSKQLHNLYNIYPLLREVYKIIQVGSSCSQHFNMKYKWIPWVRSKSTATSHSLKSQPSTPIKRKASATKGLLWEYLNKTIYLAPYNSENRKHHGKARGCSMIWHTFKFKIV